MRNEVNECPTCEAKTEREKTTRVLKGNIKDILILHSFAVKEGWSPGEIAQLAKDYQSLAVWPIIKGDKKIVDAVM